MLADWQQVSSYMNGLAQRSPYVHVDTLGRTTEGRPFLLLTINRLQSWASGRGAPA